MALTGGPSPEAAAGGQAADPFTPRRQICLFPQKEAKLPLSMDWPFYRPSGGVFGGFPRLQAALAQCMFDDTADHPPQL
jgi:hypothetical protein